MACQCRWCRCGLQPRAEAHLGSKAAYVQASYKTVPTVTATAGFRWTWDTYGGHIEQTYDTASFDVFPKLAALGAIPAASAAFLQNFGSGLCIYDAYQAILSGQSPTKKYPDCTYFGFQGKSNGPTWYAGLDWQADHDTLLYAVTRRGYKSGASNPSVALFLGESYPLFSVRPEKVTDVEVGLKRDWAFGGMRARTNISGFYTWYNDPPVAGADDRCDRYDGNRAPLPCDRGGRTVVKSATKRAYAISAIRMQAASRLVERDRTRRGDRIQHAMGRRYLRWAVKLSARGWLSRIRRPSGIWPHARSPGTWCVR